MKIREAGISLQYFKSNELLNELSAATGGAINFYTGATTDAELPEMLEQHQIQHGIGIGYLQNDDDAVLGLGGLYYQPEASLYELVYLPLTDNAIDANTCLNYLLDHAFGNLGIDKICARALPQSLIADWLNDAGFAYSGERAFTQDGREHIWQYFELENEANMVLVPAYNQSANSDWDAIF